MNDILYRSACRLAHREPEDQSEYDAGSAKGHECSPPAHVLIDPPAEQKAEQDTEIHAGGLQPDHRGAAPWMEIVRELGLHRRGGPSLADPDPDARDQ